MFSGNYNRTPHCGQSGAQGGFLMSSNQKMLGGGFIGRPPPTAALQIRQTLGPSSAGLRTFVSAVPPHMAHHSVYAPHQHYQPPAQQVQNQHFALAAFAAQYQQPLPPQPSWHHSAAIISGTKNVQPLTAKMSQYQELQPPHPSGHHSAAFMQHVPPVAATMPGFFDGIKQIVKGIINPLNCDFYTDHHRYYNPKYRNNYRREQQKAESDCGVKMAEQPEPKVKTIDTKIGKSFEIIGKEVPKRTATPNDQDNADKFVTLFTAEDFPELPAPRRRSTTSNCVSQILAAVPVAVPTPISVVVSTAAPIPILDPAAEQQTVDIALTPLIRVSKPTFCFFEIEFRSAMPIRHTFHKKPPFLSRSIPTATKNHTNDNSCHPSTVFDTQTCVNKSFKMEFCDSDDDSDDDDRISLSKKPQTLQTSTSLVDIVNSTAIAVASGADFGFGLSASIMSATTDRPARQRQISECSDDSFIVCFMDDAGDGLQAFDTEDNDSDNSNDDFDDDSSSSEEYTSDDDEDDEEIFEFDHMNITTSADVVDCSVVYLKDVAEAGKQTFKTDIKSCDIAASSKVANKNKKSTSYAVEVAVSVIGTNLQPDSGFDEDKKVRFNLQPEVHVMRAWNYAYRAARKGHWEDCARDRSRFKNRVDRIAVFLDPVLTPEHRDKIYRSRFSNTDPSDI